LNIEGFCFHPCLKARRSKKIIQTDRKSHLFFFRKKRVEIERPYFSERGILDLANQILDVEILSLSPGFIFDKWYKRCSRLFKGFASIPNHPRRLETVESTRSRKAAVSRRISSGGSLNEFRMERGTPALLTGV